MNRRNEMLHVSHYMEDALWQIERGRVMKEDFEHQTEYDEPDEDEVIDPSSYEPSMFDRALLIAAAIVAGAALVFMFTGGKLP